MVATQTTPKVEIGQLVRSYDVAWPTIDTTRGSVVGLVIGLSVDPRDGVEYVFIEQQFRMIGDKIDEVRGDIVRAPQNGTPMSLGGVCQGIRVVEEEKRTFPGTGYSRKELKAAFDKVCDSKDWKNPISARVQAADVKITVAAIEYFTATTADVLEYDTEGNRIVPKGMFLISSIGYRRGPAGDH